MWKIWRMWNTPSLLSLPGPLWLRVVASDRVLSISQIALGKGMNLIILPPAMGK